MLGPDGGKQLKAFARVGALGIELAISTVIGLLAGRWLDSKLSSQPWFTLAGLILGVIAGFRSLYITAKQQSQQSQTPPPSDRPDHHD